MAVLPDPVGVNLIYAIRLTHDLTHEYRYVGQTSRGLIRLKQHLSDARNPTSEHYQSHRANWMRKHNFSVTFDILQELDDVSGLDFAETMWVHVLRERGHRLVNHTLGGGGLRGYVPGPETREKMRNAKLDRPRTDETKAKISKFNKGKSLTDEHRQLLSETKMGELNPMFGKRSWNSGAKMSELVEGYVHPHAGKTFSDEYREKLSLAHKGKPNRGRHTRWHTNRGIVDAECVFC